MSMNGSEQLAILGTGHAVPARVRKNDDPVFDWLREHQPAGEELFTGYEERRVLGPGESGTTLMTAAARSALGKAGVAPADVDVLLGYGSLAEYVSPNDLAKVHADLGLRPDALVLPLADEFTVFNSSLLVAEGLIRAGRAHHALIVCGCNWTRVVDYHSPPSVSAGDGAGAAVVGASAEAGRFRLLGAQRLVASNHYGALYVQSDLVFGPMPVAHYSAPYFHFTEEGRHGFNPFAGQAAPEVVLRLLEDHQLSGSQVTLLCHQTSQGLLDRWNQMIQPKELLHSLRTYANLVSASIPVNLDLFGDRIGTDFVVLFGIGIQFQADAVLLARG
jgi:3-oxoacyl-[acyl-carrier-protein] synthase III